MVRCPICGSEMKISAHCYRFDWGYGLVEYICSGFGGLYCPNCGFRLSLVERERIEENGRCRRWYELRGRVKIVDHRVADGDGK